MEIKGFFIPESERETAVKAFGYQKQIRMPNPDFDAKHPESESNQLSTLGDNPTTLEEFIHNIYQEQIITQLKNHCREEAVRDLDASTASRFAKEKFENKN